MSTMVFHHETLRSRISAPQPEKICAGWIVSTRNARQDGLPTCLASSYPARTVRTTPARAPAMARLGPAGLARWRISGSPGTSTPHQCGVHCGCEVNRPSTKPVWMVRNTPNATLITPEARPRPRFRWAKRRPVYAKGAPRIMVISIMPAIVPARAPRPPPAGATADTAQARQQLLKRTLGLLVQAKMSIGLVGMGVHVRFAPVVMHVRVHNARAVLRRETLGDPACGASEVEYSEQDQHQPDRQFHPQRDARRDRKIEDDDPGPDQHDRDRVSQSPEHADHPGMAHALLAGDDRRYCNDVVGVGGVAYAQQKTDSDDGEDVDHRNPGAPFPPAPKPRRAAPSTHETTLPFLPGPAAFPPARWLVYHGCIARQVWRAEISKAGCGMALE